VKRLIFYRPWRLHAIAIATMAFAATCIAADAPRLDAVRAAKIATDYLSQCGANAPYIVSVTLQRSAIIHGTTSWVVRWSRSLAVDGDQEVGLRVNMDGSTARLIKDKGSQSSRPN
jgi:hypothetical protein